MTTRAGIGLSQQQDAWLAGMEAASQAAWSTAGPADLVIVFMTDHYQPEAVRQGICSVMGKSPVIGCCVPSLFTTHGFSAEGVAVMALAGEDLKVRLALAEGIRANPQAVGRRVIESLNKDLAVAYRANKQVAILALADALSGFMAEVVEGATDVLGPACLMVGGTACDNFKFLKSFQFIDDQIHSDALVAALLSTSSPIGVGVSHGYKPVDRPLVATRTDHNIVYEFDGQPAFEAYQRAWANEVPEVNSEGFATFAKAHPLGLPQLRGEYVIRDLVRVHPDGAIECFSTVPENAVVHMMSVDQESLYKATRGAALQALASLGGQPPAAVLVFNCISRVALLKGDMTVEIDHVRDVVGDETPLIGFFSFGEIATPPRGGLAAFYNKTVVVCALA